ncbi:hypothetical protein, partial [Pseudomonas chlororaphis]
NCISNACLVSEVTVKYTVIYRMTTNNAGKRRTTPEEANPVLASIFLGFCQFFKALVDRLALVRQILAGRAQVHLLQLVVDLFGLGRVLLGELGPWNFVAAVSIRGNPGSVFKEEISSGGGR